MNTFAQWLDKRTGFVQLWNTISHWTVPKTRCCGGVVPGMIVFAFLVQAITGIVLWVHYSPSAQTAWESVFFMQYVLPYGWLVRGIHHFSAQVLVALLVLNLLIMIIRGTYRSPREFVFWAAGILFLLALGCCLTGDLLNWSISGYSATKVRVNFLNMLPVIGPWLYKLVVGGPDFGTLTLPRFLVLHIAVCGGGFFAVLALWKWFDIRSRNFVAESCSTRVASTGSPLDSVYKPLPIPKTGCCDESRVSFWSCEAVKQSFGCLLFMLIVLGLVYQKPLIGMVDKTKAPAPSVPFQSTVGAHLTAPSGPGDFYAGARPEWSFRALYYLSNLECFPGEIKYVPIFIIPTCLGIYFILIPLIGRVPLQLGYAFNVFVVSAIFLWVCFATYKSYEHDFYSEDYQRKIKVADQNAERAIELALAPAGIPSTGAYTLLRDDPKTQGPVLYAQHCSSCHGFGPMNGEQAHPDFPAIECKNPTAPNLYQPTRKEWIAGFFDFKRITSDDYLGKTAFVLKPGQEKKDFHGKMYDFARSLPAKMEDEDLKESINPENLKKLIDVLAEEAKLDGPRSFVHDGKKLQSVEGLSMDNVKLLDDFGCLMSCHRFYDYSGTGTVTEGPDLSGYMSRKWMIGFIANPSAPHFYGKLNDRMPAYHLSDNDSTLSSKEIEIIVDWLRGKWYKKTESER